MVDLRGYRSNVEQSVNYSFDVGGFFRVMERGKKSEGDRKGELEGGKGEGDGEGEREF